MEVVQKDDREVIMNCSGSRLVCNDNWNLQRANKLILSEYQQISHNKDNVCVWYSVYLLIRLFDSQLAECLLGKYNIDCIAYKLLRMHTKVNNGIESLNLILRNDDIYYFQM